MPDGNVGSGITGYSVEFSDSGECGASSDSDKSFNLLNWDKYPGAEFVEGENKKWINSLSIERYALDIFILVKKSVSLLKYGKGGGEVAATYGVRASLFRSCFFYFSDKNGTYKFSLSLAILEKKELLEPSGKVW